MTTDLIAKAIDVNSEQCALGNERLPQAHALFVRNRETPSIYDANHVTSIQARMPAEIEELLAAADREYDGYGHRRFDVDYRTPPEFIARLLLDGGYERTDAIISLLEGDLNGKAKPCDIRRMSGDADWQEYWELQLADWREHQKRIGGTAGDDIARNMWAAKKRKQPPVQYWMAYDGEKPVAYMNSWEGTAGVGQVEDLFTDPAYRNRGVATALIHHCVAECRKNGAGPVVIVADPTDTPKNIYFRMGFRPVAIQSKYLKRLG